MDNDELDRLAALFEGVAFVDRGADRTVECNWCSQGDYLWAEVAAEDGISGDEWLGKALAHFRTWHKDRVFKMMTTGTPL